MRNYTTTCYEVAVRFRSLSRQRYKPRRQHGVADHHLNEMYPKEIVIYIFQQTEISTNSKQPF